MVITIPNSVMAESKIKNETRQVPYFRVHCRVGVGYDSDPETVEKALLQSLAGNPHVLAEPVPRVRFRAFGDSALEVELLAWIKDPRNRGPALDLMIRSALRALRQAGVEIPFPQREVALKKKKS
jgi:small-conductance mechanosensitive channel